MLKVKLTRFAAIKLLLLSIALSSVRVAVCEEQNTDDTLMTVDQALSDESITIQSLSLFDSKSSASPVIEGEQPYADEAAEATTTAALSNTLQITEQLLWFDSILLQPQQSTTDDIVSPAVLAALPAYALMLIVSCITVGL